ncbi:MAG: acyl-CoA dehydrogenase family protein [Myxococcota bacterium]
MALDPDVFAHLLATVRRFVRERLVPLEERVDREDTVPEAVVDEMRALGLFGLSIPERYGGLGLGLAEEARVVFELGWTAPAFRSVVGTNVGIGSQGILLDGTEAQKEAYLPRMATGELVGSFALTEPDVGSDAASVQTRAVWDGEAYRIHGTKRWITNAPRAGVFTLMARTGTTEERGRGVTAFLVDAALPGIELGPPYAKMGQRGTHVCDVHLDDVRVQAEAIIGGEPGRGFKTAMKVLDKGRIHIAALCVGVAERVLHEMVRFGTERVQFGKPIAEHQLVQAMIADSRAEAYAARAMVLDAARRYDAGEKVTTEAACCKLFASEMVGRVADRGVQVHGGAGYIADHAVERLYRDVRLIRLYEGTSQIQQLIIARNVVRDLRD